MNCPKCGMVMTPVFAFPRVEDIREKGIHLGDYEVIRWDCYVCNRSVTPTTLEKKTMQKSFAVGLVWWPLFSVMFMGAILVLFRTKINADPALLITAHGHLSFHAWWYGILSTTVFAVSEAFMTAHIVRLIRSPR